MSTRSLRLALLGIALLLLLPLSALADSSSNIEQVQFNPASGSSNGILDFAMLVPTSGTINYNGGPHGNAANPLVGTGISVNYVEGIDTSENDYVRLNLVGGTLKFQTGNFFSSTATTWYFNGGGMFSLSAQCIEKPHHDAHTCGGNNALYYPDLDGHPGLILTGMWDSASVEETNPRQKTQKLTGGLVQDIVWPTLLGYYGLQDPPGGGTLNGDFSLSMLANGNPQVGRGNPTNSIHSTQLLSGDFANTGIPESPEPTSLLLFGTGMIGVAGMVRRKLKSN